MDWGSPRASSYVAKLTALLSLILAAALLSASSCGLSTPPSPSPKVPSVVTTEEGIEFSVYGLKLPGSSQELKLKKGGATTWVPLSIIQVITFTGPEEDRFRPGLISLTSGERFSGEIFTDQLIEGTTDVGYWNMPFTKIRQLGMGQE